MPERSELIARKESVRARIAQVRREVESERAQPEPRTSRVHSLEVELDRLMSEEHRLRQQIDRSP